jgi:hypothetical protein
MRCAYIEIGAIHMRDAAGGAALVFDPIKAAFMRSNSATRRCDTHRERRRRMELIGAVAIVVVVLAGSCLAGKRKKQDGLARIEADPTLAARVYLRADAETGAFWLHAEMRTGKKLRLAAPWDLEATLARLATVDLHLSADDQAALAASRAVSAQGAEPQRRPAKAFSAAHA